MEKDLAWRNEKNGLLYRIAELERKLNCIRDQYQHALECVDFVFQVDSKKPPPLLPGFIEAGDDKFEGVIILAKRYKQLLGQLESLRIAAEIDADKIIALLCCDQWRANQEEANQTARNLAWRVMELIGSNA